LYKINKLHPNIKGASKFGFSLFVGGYIFLKDHSDLNSTRHRNSGKTSGH